MFNNDMVILMNERKKRIDDVHFPSPFQTGDKSLSSVVSGQTPALNSGDIVLEIDLF